MIMATYDHLLAKTNKATTLVLEMPHYYSLNILLDIRRKNNSIQYIYKYINLNIYTYILILI